VFHASKACGPLFQWASSQVSYCTVLHTVAPLREEVTHLEQKSEKLRLMKQNADDTVAQLAEDIER